MGNVGNRAHWTKSARCALHVGWCGFRGHRKLPPATTAVVHSGSQHLGGKIPLREGEAGVACHVWSWFIAPAETISVGRN
jgi:hypothetical protein